MALAILRFLVLTTNCLLFPPFLTRTLVDTRPTKHFFCLLTHDNYESPQRHFSSQHTCMKYRNASSHDFILAFVERLYWRCMRA